MVHPVLYSFTPSPLAGNISAWTLCKLAPFQALWQASQSLFSISPASRRFPSEALILLWQPNALYFIFSPGHTHRMEKSWEIVHFLNRSCFQFSRSCYTFQKWDGSQDRWLDPKSFVEGLFAGLWIWRQVPSSVTSPAETATDVAGDWFMFGVHRCFFFGRILPQTCVFPVLFPFISQNSCSWSLAKPYHRHHPGPLCPGASSAVVSRPTFLSPSLPFLCPSSRFSSQTVPGVVTGLFLFLFFNNSAPLNKLSS